MVLKNAWPLRSWGWVLGALGVILVGTALLLDSQGRLWICSCGSIRLWAGDIWSSDNSQHLFDPYSFTHVLHGFLFFWLLTWALPRVALEWRFVLALLIEAVWEVVENSAFVIQRYRETTLALGYEGDTIVNSLVDIALCGLGFYVAWYLGFKRALALFLLVELILLVWIRDGLLLNIIMLIYPIEAVKAWQFGG